MYQIRDDFCCFVPNWAFVESVAEIRFADLPTLGDLRRMTALPVPQFSIIERALGHEIHNAVFGGKSPRQALRDAENVILKQINGQRGVKG